jgi:bifunctional non-homologous end joining protein LigD
MYSPFTGVMVYYVFDILWYDGFNLMNAPLIDRRKVLKSILPTSNIIRFSDHIDRKGKELFNLPSNTELKVLSVSAKKVYTFQADERKSG